MVSFTLAGRRTGAAVRLLLFAGAAVLAVAAGGCKRSRSASRDALEIQPAFARLHRAAGDRAAAPSTAGAGSPATDAAAAEGAARDYIQVEGRHDPPEPTDPVRVRFRRFRVTKAHFDPRHPEGGSAVIEIDLTSVSSGDARRDARLRSARYLDVARYPEADVAISAVKKVQGNHYNAEAKISAHGGSVTWPVEFDITRTAAGSVRVRGSHIFDRRAFGIGRKIAAPIGREIAVDLAITLHPTR